MVNTIPMGLTFLRGCDFCIVNRREGSEEHDTKYNLLTCLGHQKKGYWFTTAKYFSSEIKDGVEEGGFELVDRENAQELIKRLSPEIRGCLRHLGIDKLVLDFEGNVRVPLPY